MTLTGKTENGKDFGDWGETTPFLLISLSLSLLTKIGEAAGGLVAIKGLCDGAGNGRIGSDGGHSNAAQFVAIGHFHNVLAGGRCAGSRGRSLLGGRHGRHGYGNLGAEVGGTARERGVKWRAAGGCAAGAAQNRRIAGQNAKPALRFGGLEKKKEKKRRKYRKVRRLSARVVWWCGGVVVGGKTRRWGGFTRRMFCFSFIPSRVVPELIEKIYQFGTIQVGALPPPTAG